ncbi:MAG: ABC transporter ATP-binding protein [Gillisia sp.]
MSNILKAENISKQYRLGDVGTGTLTHDFNRWWASLRGKEDPYLKVGAVNDRSAKATEDYVWALRDINFEVKRGEVLGIIGKNGAGKSTLLKILSRVTSPSTGTIKTSGRIASLLEVGTGFHGELSGRENIFMNGAILGMTKKEIKRKLDEIIDFSGCEMYIDTPVKRYSSGMTVRLGFAVAAHLEPEILVVDEVLAVGDSEFQKKAIGKMQDLSIGQGRTVLFVSHNMASIENLCTKLIVLENGGLAMEGDVKDSIEFYLRNNGFKGINKSTKKTGAKNIGIKEINFIINSRKSFPVTGEPLTIEFILDIFSEQKFKSLRLDFKFEDRLGNRIAWFSTAVDPNFDSAISITSKKILFHFEKFSIVQGSYILSYNLYANGEVQEDAQQYLAFEVSQGAFYKSTINITPHHTPILLDYIVGPTPQIRQF